MRGRKRRRIQEEEELVTSSIVQVAIIVLPPLVVFHTKLFGLLITRANKIFFVGVHNADGGVHRASRRGLEVHQVDQQGLGDAQPWRTQIVLHLRR